MSLVTDRGGHLKIFVFCEFLHKFLFVEFECPVSLELNKVKEHASDLQTFLCLPHLISKANDEEKNVEKLGSEDKFNRKSIIFTARIDEIIKIRSVLSCKLYSENTISPLSKIEQPVSLLDGYPVVTFISFRQFKMVSLHVLLVNGPMITQIV
jgi:hypothetical protein